MERLLKYLRVHTHRIHSLRHWARHCRAAPEAHSSPLRWRDSSGGAEGSRFRGRTSPARRLAGSQTPTLFEHCSEMLPIRVSCFWAFSFQCFPEGCRRFLSRAPLGSTPPPRRSSLIGVLGFQHVLGSHWADSQSEGTRGVFDTLPTTPTRDVGPGSSWQENGGRAPDPHSPFDPILAWRPWAPGYDCAPRSRSPLPGTVWNSPPCCPAGWLPGPAGKRRQVLMSI